MKPRKRKEVAAWYGYSAKSLKKLLQEKNIELPLRRRLCIDDQLMVYAYLGIPSELPVEELSEVLKRLAAYCEQNNIPYVEWCT